MGEAGGQAQLGPAWPERGASRLTAALTALGFLGLLMVAGVVGPTLQVGQARRELNRRFGLGGGGGPPPPQLRPAPQLPKVALLFLSRGDLPYEPLWRAFLDAATEVVQQAAPPGVSPADWRQLFSLYTHPAPNHTHPAGSLFAGHEVPGRATVQWGDHSMIDAERALLREALRDPLNQRFLLISDSCIPVLPPAAVWVELMAESRSRTHFCNNQDNPADLENPHMVHRWQAPMASFGVRREAWRKGSQWFSLVRRHAEVVAADMQADAAFRQECWATGWDPPPPPEARRDCISDEHYIPVLLVLLGLEQETLCYAGVTFTFWGTGGAHPYTFYAKDATPDKLAEFRGGAKCNSSAVLVPQSIEVLRRAWQPPGDASDGSDAPQLWRERSSDLLRLQPPQQDGSSQQQQQQQQPSSSAPGAPAPAPADPAPAAAAPALPARITDLMLGEGALREVGQHLIEWCPLLARKLAPDAASVAAWTRLLSREFAAATAEPSPQSS